MSDDLLLPIGHRGHRPRQGVRRDPRRRRRRPRRPQRLRLRRPRPERRRQDDHHPDAGDAAAPGRAAARACSATTSSSEADAVRAAVSLTGQLASVDEDLTGRENLILLGRLLGPQARRAPRRAPTSCSRRFGLSEAAGRLVKNYSGGMRRRLDIAASLVVTPELMFLDEPTTGLDPRSRNQVWDIIRALVAERHHDPALHAVPGGGRPARRRHRRDRPRQGDRRGNAGPAEGVGRLRRAARAAARSRAAARGRAAARPRELGAVHLEPDPAALSARCADAEPRRRAPSPSSAALGHRSRRLLARPAQPRRGLPRPHRPPRRGGRQPTTPPGGAAGHEQPTASPAIAGGRRPRTGAAQGAVASTPRPPRAERRCRPP